MNDFAENEGFEPGMTDDWSHVPNRAQRRGNRQRMRPVKPIRCIGGPYDGQSTKMMNPGPKLKLTIEQEDGSKVTHIYGRKNTRSGVEYHFKETVPA